MEAGIEPASPLYNKPSAYSTAVDLCHICTILIQHLQQSYNMKEQALITDLLSTVNTHMIINTWTAPHNIIYEHSMELHSKTLTCHNYIWSQLTTTLHSTDARRYIFNFLQNLEQFYSAVIDNTPPLAPPCEFLMPANKAFPWASSLGSYSDTRPICTILKKKLLFPDIILQHPRHNENSW